MIDYLIVGCGLAGIAFGETASQHNKSILFFENNSQRSSKVAGGLYNPVILKRYSGVWRAQEQLDLLQSFYRNLEAKLNTRFNFKTPVYRKLFSVEEQNDWFLATDRVGLSPFLSSKLVSKKYKAIDSPYNFGEVLQSGYVDTDVLLSSYRNYLKENNLLQEDTFEYSAIGFKENHIQYKGIEARNIVFAEGYGMVGNPYFGQLPLKGTKGELLIIKAKDLDLDAIIKASVFVLPLGNDLYKVGATYSWEDKTNLPTEEGKKELLEKSKEVLQCDFEIVEHLAGIRPTVADRKPLVGTHPKYRNLHVLNGLGTRGVMIGPDMAKQLFESIEMEKPIDSSADIMRFKKIKW
ncbi:NAD(P)/FAD-dependent oxidoreductase [Flavobacterium microcysteis]|uniref:FAD-dependent oxidoreductase n=1 Tax=Flavobacterium microcysteis TaxID=2596891 RepID=A0A501PZ33_9FLAO|nr:FAD-binding oxidoreductase [Flavobacterium microcysteis]TPD65683.1 FAD-dependent oxidoreductase [Flavobacterium microcysteis]